MKTTLLLSLALALPVFTSCGEATDAAGKAGDAATAAAGKVGDAFGDLKNLDVSSMSMDAVKEKAGSMIGTITEKLGTVKDAASAEKFKTMASPAIEALGKMKDKLGASLPNADSLKSALSSFKMDGKIGEVLGPIIEKLKALVN